MYVNEVSASKRKIEELEMNYSLALEAFDEYAKTIIGLEEKLSNINFIHTEAIVFELTKYVSEEKAREYCKYVMEASKLWQIDPAVIIGLLLRESSGNWKSDSGSSVGLMQVNWGVHKDLLRVHFKVKDRKQLFNPRINILAGTYLLKRYYEDEGNCIASALTRYLGASNSQYKLDVLKCAMRINDKRFNKLENLMRNEEEKKVVKNGKDDV